jgi:hypothetical protein
MPSHSLNLDVDGLLFCQTCGGLSAYRGAELSSVIFMHASPGCPKHSWQRISAGEFERRVTAHHLDIYILPPKLDLTISTLKGDVGPQMYPSAFVFRVGSTGYVLWIRPEWLVVSLLAVASLALAGRWISRRRRF